MSLRVGLRAWAALVAVVALACLTSAGTAAAGTLKPSGSGELDCNGQSAQQTSVNMRLNCTDIRGYDNEWNANTWSGRFYDNGHYIGHDEPDMTFLSSSSRDPVTTSPGPRRFRLDPSAAPTVSTPGSDVNHWFELSVAPWFSMAMCDSNSYPQSTLHAAERLERADVRRHRNHRLLPGRGLCVHGDAAVSARHAAVRRFDQLR